MLSRDIAKEVCRLARIDAAERRNMAGYNGERHDGGCQRLLDIVDAWESGGMYTIPSTLTPYLDEAIKLQERRGFMKDPEWETYVRLWKKFRGSKP